MGCAASTGFAPSCGTDVPVASPDGCASKRAEQYGKDNQVAMMNLFRALDVNADGRVILMCIRILFDCLIGSRRPGR